MIYTVQQHWDLTAVSLHLSLSVLEHVCQQITIFMSESMNNSHNHFIQKHIQEWTSMCESFL